MQSPPEAFLRAPELSASLTRTGRADVPVLTGNSGILPIQAAQQELYRRNTNIFRLHFLSQSSIKLAPRIGFGLLYCDSEILSKQKSELLFYLHTAGGLDLTPKFADPTKVIPPNPVVSHVQTVTNHKSPSTTLSQRRLLFYTTLQYSTGTVQHCTLLIYCTFCSPPVL